jgi:hypothetical protein
LAEISHTFVLHNKHASPHSIQTTADMLFLPCGLQAWLMQKEKEKDRKDSAGSDDTASMIKGDWCAYGDLRPSTAPAIGRSADAESACPSSQQALPPLTLFRPQLTCFYLVDCRHDWCAYGDLRPSTAPAIGRSVETESACPSSQQALPRLTLSRQ